MMTSAERVGRARRRLPLVFGAAFLLPLLAGGGNVPVASAASTASAFAFNWAGSPATPRAWVPGSMNDWDMLQSSINPSDELKGGSFPASHGADCGPPPAVHTASTLADTAYICRDHMMTATNDTDVFFTPNRLVDFSRGPSTVTWQVSTSRFSSRDWWEVWLMPFAENFLAPTDDAPAYNGNPPDSLHIVMAERNGCSQGQPTWGTDANTGSHLGTFFEYVLYKGNQTAAKGGGGDCMEDAAGGVSSKIRSTFQLTVSQSHVNFMMHGVRDATWIDEGLSLPFNQAVIVWAHRSYNPSKACGFDGSCGPSTFHWSNVSISPALPFTLLRPIGQASVHDGTATTVSLPAPAPASSFLRFLAYGNIRVSFDGGAFVSAHMQDTADQPGAASNYFTPVPAGTTKITFQGSPRGGNVPWWIEDVAVWASTVPPLSAAAAPAPAQGAAAQTAVAPFGGALLTEWDALRGQGRAPAHARAAAISPLAALTRIPPFVSGFGSALALMALTGLGYVVLRRRQRRRPRGGFPRPPG